MIDLERMGSYHNCRPFVALDGNEHNVHHPHHRLVPDSAHYMGHAKLDSAVVHILPNHDYKLINCVPNHSGSFHCCPLSAPRDTV